MPNRPGRKVEPDKLRADAEARRRQVEGQLLESSGAPPAMYGACDPMVEARLADDVLNIFLRHMSQDRVTETVLARQQEQLAENAVSESEVYELFANSLKSIDHQAPDVLERLEQERFWCLADIASQGSGIARQRATLELRAAMHTLDNWEGIDEAVLRELVRTLELERRQQPSNVMLEALYASAQRALARLGNAAR